MNKEEMISKIYEVIPCSYDRLNDETLWKVIRIWDVLDWMDRNIRVLSDLDDDVWSLCVDMNISLKHLELLAYRENKREPIEKQIGECITFIYYLVNPSK